MSDDQDAGTPSAGVVEDAGDEPRAWRLTFGYRGDRFEMLAQQRIEMIAPPDDSPRTYAARAGTWVEVRDAEGHGLYRQILFDPVRRGYEAHGPEGSHETLPAEPEGVFQVVVPDLPGAADVVLHRLADPIEGDAAPSGAAAVAAPVLTEPLHETGPFEVP